MKTNDLWKIDGGIVDGAYIRSAAREYGFPEDSLDTEEAARWLRAWGYKVKKQSNRHALPTIPTL